MIPSATVIEDDVDDRIGVGLEDDDVLVAVVAPRDVDEGEVDEALDRLGQVTRYELEAQRRKESSGASIDDAEDTFRDDLEARRSRTKYGDLVTDGGEVAIRPYSYRCEACEEIVDGVPWAVGGGTPAGDVLELGARELADVCDDCMDRIEAEIADEELATDGGVPVDEVVPPWHKIDEPETRLRRIASEARNLRLQLDLEPGDLPDLAGIAVSAKRVGKRHGIEVCVDLSDVLEEGGDS